MVVAGLFLGLPGLFLDMVGLILGKALEGSMSYSEDKSSEHFLRCAFSSFSSLLLETKMVPHFQHGLKSISTLAFWEDVGPALTFDNAGPAFEEAAFDEAGPGFVEAGPGYEKAAFDEAGPGFLEAGPGFSCETKGIVLLSVLSFPRPRVLVVLLLLLDADCRC